MSNLSIGGGIDSGKPLINFNGGGDMVEVKEEGSIISIYGDRGVMTIDIRKMLGDENAVSR